MKKKHYLKAFLLAFALCIAITSVFPTVVYASYDSWVEDTDGYDEIYGNGTQFDTVDGEPLEEDVKEEASFFEWYIAGAIRHLGTGLWWLEKKGHMDMDRVILGRIHKDVQNNLYGFDLSNGNIYGTISSIIYALLRNFIFGLFGVYFVVMLLEYLIKGTGTRRANMKEMLENFIFSFLLLYAIPILVDIIIFSRDCLIFTIQYFLNSVLGTSGVSIVDIFFQESKDTGLISYSLLFLVSACAGIYLAVNYVKIALQEAYLFAAFPFVALKGLRDKNILGKWTGQFITNLAVPLIDCAGLGMIIMAGEIFGGPDAGVGQAFVRLIMFCLLVPSRNIILQLFGAPVPARGMSFLPFMFMAARMAMMKQPRAGAPETGGETQVPATHSSADTTGNQGTRSTISAPASMNDNMNSIDRMEETAEGAREITENSATETNMESFNGSVSDSAEDMESLSGNGSLETNGMAADNMAVSEDMESINGPGSGTIDEMDGLADRDIVVSGEEESITAPASVSENIDTMPNNEDVIQSIDGEGIKEPMNTDMETTAIAPETSENEEMYYAQNETAEVMGQSVSAVSEGMDEWTSGTGQSIYSPSGYKSDMESPVMGAASIQSGQISSGGMNEIAAPAGKIEIGAGVRNVQETGKDVLANTSSMEKSAGKVATGEINHVDGTASAKMEQMPAHGHGIEEKTVSGGKESVDGPVNDPISEIRKKEIIQAKQAALDTDKKYGSGPSNNHADYDAEKHNIARQQQLKAAAKNVAKVTVKVGEVAAVTAGVTTAVGLTAISGNPSTMAMAALGGGFAVKSGVNAIGGIGKKADSNGNPTSNNRNNHSSDKNAGKNESGRKGKHGTQKDKTQRTQEEVSGKSKTSRERKVQNNRKQQAADAMATLDNMFGKDE